VACALVHALPQVYRSKAALAEADDPEHPLLDELMGYAEVMVASFDAVRRLLLAAPHESTGLVLLR